MRAGVEFIGKTHANKITPSFGAQVVNNLLDSHGALKGTAQSPADNYTTHGIT
jgi:hypothetical protein